MWLALLKFVSRLCVKTFELLYKTALLAVAISIVVPPLFFAWRASRPMALPQFKGLSYYELVSRRLQAYNELAHQYQAKHRDRAVTYLTCLVPDIGVQIVGAFPMAGFYTLAGLQPALQPYVNPADVRRGLVPKNLNWQEFLPAWWETFEKLISGMIVHSPNGPVPYCRIHVP